jgi:uncharacterized protein (DUF1810 family)
LASLLAAGGNRKVTTDDPYDLCRFVVAQGPVFDTVLAELRDGRKRTHWMWFVFPQLRGLGPSATAQAYGVSSLEEARAYLAHPLLGERLVRCTDAVIGIRHRRLREIFGTPDDLKFCSCMTLFSMAAGDAGSIFEQAVEQLCEGRMDVRTLDLLGSGHR